MGRARKRRQANRKKHVEMRHELSRRAAVKVQSKEQKERQTIEMKLKVSFIDALNTPQVYFAVNSKS